MTAPAYKRVPATISRLVLPQPLARETTRFLQAVGAEGNEGRVYWLGEIESSLRARITEAFIPKQIARRSIFGVSVEVPQSAHVDLLEHLGPGLFTLAKVHSHPGRAYLSDTDEENPHFRHDGAFSIIVPDFAQRGLDDLADCAVFRFSSREWRQLSSQDVEAAFEVVP